MLSARPRSLWFLELARATIGALLFVVGAPMLATMQTEQLQLASTPWSPFTNEPGQARYAIDLVAAALQRVGISVETTIVEESRLTPALLAGEFHGSAALWRDDQRERTLVYSEPYLENRLILVGGRGRDVSATTLGDLAGQRVALVEGYAYGDAVENAPGPSYVSSRGPEDSLRKLLDGEADYALMDELVVQYILTNHAEVAQARLAFGMTPLVTRTLHLALRRDLPDAESIITRFNEELSEEYVPRDDRAGPLPPEHGYQLFTTKQLTPERRPARRFYFGGDVYEDWSTVPDRYKAPSVDPQPGQYPVRVFRFTW
jgi:polar amino acid transport system substrate-binding protein